MKIQRLNHVVQIFEDFKILKLGTLSLTLSYEFWSHCSHTIPQEFLKFHIVILLYMQITKNKIRKS